MEQCPHYFRNCKFISPCCNKIYTCRFCHNENEPSHEINRFDVKEIVCAKCNAQQPVSNKCVSCEIEFARYFCKICNFFDDRIERNYFHCDKCGFCRVGNDGKYIHCDTCNTCVVDNKEAHICRKDAFHTECPICLDDIFNSIRQSFIMPCGHAIHEDCLISYTDNYKINCPLCRKSLYIGEALEKITKYIDEQIEKNPIDEEHLVDIRCNDCDFRGEVKYHYYGLKCGGCGGYNTTGT